MVTRVIDKVPKVLRTVFIKSHELPSRAEVRSSLWVEGSVAGTLLRAVVQERARLFRKSLRCLVWGAENRYKLIRV